MKRECNWCKVEYNYTDKRSKYCSLSCAGKVNGQAKCGDETRAKMRASGRARYGNRPIVVKMTKDEQSAHNRKLWFDRMMSDPWENLGTATRFKRVKEEQNHACNGCGNDQWRGLPITLEIEHKSGDSTDHSRSNLEALCPNCHSQTDTWRGRNARKKISDEDFLAALKREPSITKALLSLGIAAKGGNYVRAKRLLGLEETTKLPRTTGNIVDFT